MFRVASLLSLELYFAEFPDLPNSKKKYSAWSSGGYSIGLWQDRVVGAQSSPTFLSVRT